MKGVCILNCTIPSGSARHRDGEQRKEIGADSWHQLHAQEVQEEVVSSTRQDLRHE